MVLAIFLLFNCCLNYYLPASRTARFQACLVNCTSPKIRTSSLTSTPPVYSAAFQFSPQSLRLIFPLNEKPAFCLPQGSLLTPPNSTSSLISLLTPLMLNLPFNTYSSSLSFSKLLLSKVISGCASTSKKSPLFRCLSRSSLLV